MVRLPSDWKMFCAQHDFVELFLGCLLCRWGWHCIDWTFWTTMMRDQMEGKWAINTCRTVERYKSRHFGHLHSLYERIRKWIIENERKLYYYSVRHPPSCYRTSQKQPFWWIGNIFSKQNQSFLNLYMIGTLCSSSGKVITDPDLMSITGPGHSRHHILTVCLMRSQTTRLF